ncbi:MAG: GIY-YIG nuclease family protein [Pseudoflavonifractor sp.]
MDYYVYILANKTNVAIYIGVTNHLVRRIYEHKHHADPSSHTAKYGIDKLVYFEATQSSYTAISREKQLKGWNRQRKNRMITEHNPTWEDLYETLL